MAKNETKRLRPVNLTEDTNTYSALEDITDYNPSNLAFTLAIGATKHTTMSKVKSDEAKAEVALKTARDNAVAAEWDFHNYILGVKSQVVAQYGESSNEMQSLGLKKKTEYKTPGKKKNDPK